MATSNDRNTQKSSTDRKDEESAADRLRDVGRAVRDKAHDVAEKAVDKLDPDHEHDRPIKD